MGLSPLSELPGSPTIKTSPLDGIHTGHKRHSATTRQEDGRTRKKDPSFQIDSPL
jgi:hypothetical protein